MKKIIIAGLGPGSPEDMTSAVLAAIGEAEVVVGYKYYFRFVQPYLKEGCKCIDTGMKRERERAEQAFRMAEEGRMVVVISSGDAGIYGMAPLIYEMKRERASDVEISCLPGISAFQKAASLLGAPIGHDMCIISLSDLMTPWAVIEKRIKAAAVGDFVTVVDNPKSHDRYWQLYRLLELFLLERKADTPVGYVRQAGRPEQEVKLITLGTFDPEDVDMFTVIIIGNSQSYIDDGHFITPRGYYREEQDTEAKPGQQIMMQSFRTILAEMQHPEVPRWRLWPLLHAIHTTVDFGMEQCLWMDKEATEVIYNKVSDGSLRHIVTDVTMAASGIRKGALDRLDIQVHCYINDPRSKQMAEEQGITRSQASMQLAAKEHPDALYVVGNAPTALFEICDLVRKGRLHPAGIIAAPVGFVHVCESKHAAKALTQIPKIIIEGRKGGSNLAATLCNAILTYDDAAQLIPGRDL